MTFLVTFSTLIFDFPFRDTLHASRNTSDERQATSDEVALFWSFFVVFCAFLWLKNPYNQRNPWLINDLRSTNYYVRNYKKNMQNEPNLPDDQMNVNKVLTKDYENKPNWTLGENKPNQSQCRKSG